jgi:beta-glucosidase
VQSYTRTRIGVDGPVPAPDDAERTLTGGKYYPEAIGHAQRHTAAVVGDIPLIVTRGSYQPTFGLIAVDPDTFTRTPKPSAAWLGDFARTRVLPRVTV